MSFLCVCCSVLNTTVCTSDGIQDQYSLKMKHLQVRVWEIKPIHFTHSCIIFQASHLFMCISI